MYLCAIYNYHDKYIMILFVIENGQWQLSEVQTLSDSEFGFTENYTRLRTLIPVEHKSDNQISFKFSLSPNFFCLLRDNLMIAAKQTARSRLPMLDGNSEMGAQV